MSEYTARKGSARIGTYGRWILVLLATYVAGGNALHRIHVADEPRPVLAAINLLRAPAARVLGHTNDDPRRALHRHPQSRSVRPAQRRARGSRHIAHNPTAHSTGIDR